MIKQIGGTTSAVIAGACCLGFTPLLAALGAIGAGFLIRDAILIPLFVLSLAFTLWSLRGSRARHGRSGPLYLGLAGAVVAFAALWFLVPLAYAGLVGFVAAAAWDVVALMRCRASGNAPEAG